MAGKITYNPMSKEFQDECKKLGLSGRQLTALYKREGRSIEKGVYVGGGRSKNWRISVSLDGENFFWVVAIDGRLIKNPTKEDLIGTKLKSYNGTNICPICREEWEREEKELTDKSILYPKNSRRNIDVNGNLVDKFVCYRHSSINYQKYVTDSVHNIKKSLSDRRTDNLRDPIKIFGDNCEKLTEKWLGAKRLSVKYDNYSNLPLDHDHISKHIMIMVGDELIDLYGKVPQTKGVHLGMDGRWICNTKNERNKKFDILIFYCISEDGETVERIYFFYKNDMQKSISITKNLILKGCEHHEECKITDDQIFININKIWNEIINKKI